MSLHFPTISLTNHQKQQCIGAEGKTFVFTVKFRKNNIFGNILIKTEKVSNRFYYIY